MLVIHGDLGCSQCNRRALSLWNTISRANPTTRIVGVSIARDRRKAWKSARGIVSYPVYFDSAGVSLSRALGVTRVPAVLVVSEGVISAAHCGFPGALGDSTSVAFADSVMARSLVPEQI